MHRFQYLLQHITKKKFSISFGVNLKYPQPSHCMSINACINMCVCMYIDGIMFSVTAWESWAVCSPSFSWIIWMSSGEGRPPFISEMFALWWFFNHCFQQLSWFLLMVGRVSERVREKKRLLLFCFSLRLCFVSFHFFTLSDKSDLTLRKSRNE